MISLWLVRKVTPNDGAHRTIAGYLNEGMARFAAGRAVGPGHLIYLETVEVYENSDEDRMADEQPFSERKSAKARST